MNSQDAIVVADHCAQFLYVIQRQPAGWFLRRGGEGLTWNVGSAEFFNEKEEAIDQLHALRASGQEGEPMHVRHIGIAYLETSE